MQRDHLLVALGLSLGLSSAAVGCGGFGFGGGRSGGDAAGSTAPASTAPATTGTTTPGSTRQAPSLTKITIETAGLTIFAPGVGQQLQVSGVDSDGHVRDITHDVTWTVADGSILSIDGSAVAWPLAAGQTTIEADLDGLSARAPIAVDPASLAPAPPAPPAPPKGAPTWDADVFPLLRDSLSCKSCHEHPKGRFKMTLVEDTDYVFATTHGYFEPKNPALSRFILKATGRIAHGGGQSLDPADPAIATLEAWIAAGTPYDAAGDVPAPTPVLQLAKLPPPNALILTPPSRNLVAFQPQQLLVLAWWSNGMTADVTFGSEVAVSDASIATVDSNGLLTPTGNVGTVNVMATWQGVVTSALCACDPTAPLSDGNDPDCITLNPHAPPTIVCIDVSGSMTPVPGATPSFATAVDPLFYGSLTCSNCHTPTSGGRFHLFHDPAQDLAGIDANALVDATDPASSLLLTTATNATGSHPGGVALDPAGGDYATILAWIQGGAK